MPRRCDTTEAKHETVVCLGKSRVTHSLRLEESFVHLSAGVGSTREREYAMEPRRKVRERTEAEWESERAQHSRMTLRESAIKPSARRVASERTQ